MDKIITNKFESFPQGLAKEIELRKAYWKDPVEFGVKFLDDALEGIFPNDLIVITSSTGIGKTELATQIAFVNAAKGKKVHYFALEAERGEIQRRIKYKKLVNKFYGQLIQQERGEKPSYMKWLRGKQEHLLSQFEEETNIELSKELQSLSIRYRDIDFSAKDFQIEAQSIQDETDLIILDHFHYLDTHKESEKDFLSEAMKFIRDVCLLTGKPIILIAHTRKQDRRNKSLIPSIEDIHGTSDIGKICTKAISFAPAWDQPSSESHKYPTYFKIQKNRTDGTRTRWVGLFGFNVRTGKYEDKYYLGKLNREEDTFTSVADYDYPDWAKAPPIVEIKTEIHNEAEKEEWWKK